MQWAKLPRAGRPAAIAGAVVGKDPLGMGAHIGDVADGPGPEAGGGHALLGAGDLVVGQPAVVVNGRVTKASRSG